MKRTTIFVPEALERDLQLYANRVGRPVASVAREALAEYLVRRRDKSALPSFAGRFASGTTDTAEHHEELLYKDLTPHGDQPQSHKPKRARQRRSRKRR
jgi:predicted transcriptional regulator